MSAGEDMMPDCSDVSTHLGRSEMSSSTLDGCNGSRLNRYPGIMHIALDGKFQGIDI